jgi:hypothetical protein
MLWDYPSGRQRLRYSSGHRGNVFQARPLADSNDATIITCAADGQASRPAAQAPPGLGRAWGGVVGAALMPAIRQGGGASCSRAVVHAAVAVVTRRWGMRLL